MIRIVFTSLALCVALIGSSLAEMTAQQIVEHEIIVTNEDGSQTLKREPAKLVTPGDRLVYTLNYLNEGAEPANGIVLVMPVPAEVLFQEGSADRAGARASFSADGGKTYSPRADLTIVLVEGSRLAQSADITHIRWHLETPVAPGGQNSLSFKAVLK